MTGIARGAQETTQTGNTVHPEQWYLQQLHNSGNPTRGGARGSQVPQACSQAHQELGTNPAPTGSASQAFGAVPCWADNPHSCSSGGFPLLTPAVHSAIKNKTRWCSFSPSSLNPVSAFLYWDNWRFLVFGFWLKNTLRASNQNWEEIRGTQSGEGSPACGITYMHAVRKNPIFFTELSCP